MEKMEPLISFENNEFKMIVVEKLFQEMFNEVARSRRYFKM